MNLRPILIPQWPKLAWVAHVAAGRDAVTVLHGPMVEVRDDWLCEAVWAGEFEAGDFDRTELVFGSGLRVRDDGIRFVGSGSILDRLWHCERADGWRVSNSLPALLAATGASLSGDGFDYAAALRSVCKGLARTVREFPTDAGPVRVCYFHNLHFDGQALVEIDKPDTAPAFACFDDYFGYLGGAAEAIGRNLADPARRHPVVPLASVSSGYDSAAAAAVARLAGCRRAVTIRTATSLWRGGDSGSAVARALGMTCREYPRTAPAYPDEDSVWAVVGRPGVLNWTLFDYPGPLCLFFSGVQGDKVWDRRPHELADPLVLPSVAHLGFGEFRLLRGVFHFPVPVAGIRRWRDLQAISRRDEMRPWTLGNDYDRPVPRRIAEQAGVPRGAFGWRKKNTSHEAAFLWPYSPESRRRFAEYLARTGRRPWSAGRIWLARRLAHFDRLVALNLPGRWHRRLRLRERLGGPSADDLFLWANAELKERYSAGLRAAGVSPGAAIDLPVTQPRPAAEPAAATPSGSAPAPWRVPAAERLILVHPEPSAP